MIRERMPDAPVDSADMIFDPDIVARFADCGVTLLDEPTDVHADGARSISATTPTASIRAISPTSSSC